MKGKVRRQTWGVGKGAQNGGREEREPERLEASSGQREGGKEDRGETWYHETSPDMRFCAKHSFSQLITKSRRRPACAFK